MLGSAQALRSTRATATALPTCRTLTTTFLQEASLQEPIFPMHLTQYWAAGTNKHNRYQAHKMAQWVRGLAAKADDLSSIPRNLMVGENQLLHKVNKLQKKCK